MRLTLGPRSYDLRTRALVMGVSGAPEDLVEQGADIVEAADLGQPMPVPVCVSAPDDDMVRRALAADADLLRLPQPTSSSLAMCAAGGVAVIVPSAAAADATAAGLPPDRVVLDAVLLDVTNEEFSAAATAVAVIRGARIVRTSHVCGARRVCDILAAVMGPD